jgi:hypothetical protein
MVPRKGYREAWVALFRSGAFCMTNVILIPEFLHLSSKFWPISGVNSMHCEYFCATPSWRQEGPRYDCIYVNSEPKFKGVCGLEITCVLVFFSFVANDSEDEYECALIHWFGTELDEKGLLLVEPAYDDDENPHLTIIHIDCIFRTAPLLPVFQTNQYIYNARHTQYLQAILCKQICRLPCIRNFNLKCFHWALQIAAKIIPVTRCNCRYTRKPWDTSFVQEAKVFCILKQAFP